MKSIANIEDDRDALISAHSLAVVTMFFASKIIQNYEMLEIFVSIYMVAAILNGIIVMMLNDPVVRHITIIPIMIGNCAYIVHETLLLKYVAESKHDGWQSIILGV